MSMALLAGSIVAYPMNWWLVRYHLKHGMMTVPPRVGLESVNAVAREIQGATICGLARCNRKTSSWPRVP